MTIMQFILIAVTVISSILLLILILLQKTKADGLGLAFGSGVGEALFGSRAGNILSKLTIALACVFLGSTLLLSIVVRRRARKIPDGSADGRDGRFHGARRSTKPSAIRSASSIAGGPGDSGRRSHSARHVPGRSGDSTSTSRSR